MKSNAKRAWAWAAVSAGVLLLGAACTTVQSSEALAFDERWSYTVRELPGREERLRGELSFRGRRTPQYFSEVVVGSRRFTAALRITGDGFEGYREDRDSQPPRPGVSGSSLSSRERRRGWYIAGIERRRPGTPQGWIWIRREDLEAWVNPLRIEAFAGHFQLAEMHEAREPRFQFMFGYRYQS